MKGGAARLIAALLLAAAGQAGGHAAPGGGTTLRPDPARPPVPSDPNRTVDQGIAVDFEAQPLAPAGGGAATGGLREGDAARFRFRISDSRTGKPLPGLYPAAWVDAVVAAPWIEGDPNECRHKIEGFVGGGLFAKPEIDLNSYYVLALNDDASISVFDPLYGLGGSKLLAMVQLASPGEDWAMQPAAGRLFVALPASGSVAVVDLTGFEVTASLKVGFPPRRVALQPDGGYLWVLGDGGAGAAVFDARSLAPVARPPVGRGAHDVAFSADSRFAFVTNREGGTVSVIAVGQPSQSATVATGRRPVSVAFSSQGRAAYVSDALDGTVAVIDPERRRVVSRIAVAPGIGQVSFAPGGRFAFVVNTPAGKVHILDAASNRLVQTAQVESGPDQVDFTGELAYVRHRGSETVLTIPLKDIGKEGTPVSVMDVPGGQKPPGNGALPGPAAGIVKAPGAGAVLIANPGDRTIYYYQEGMAAPMGGFSDDERQPRAVLVVDRSLRESAPGSYETVAQLRRPGRFQVAFFLDSPRLVHCFDIDVATSPELERQRRAALPPRVEYLDPGAGRTVQVGRPFKVRLKLSDPVTGAPLAGLPDVAILCFKPPGTHQIHGHAEQVAAGTYEAVLQLDEPGGYRLYVAAASRQLPFDRSPALDLEAAAAP